METLSSHTSEIKSQDVTTIMERLYGRSGRNTKEAQDFVWFFCKLVGRINAGEMSIDRVLTLASDVAKSHRGDHRTRVRKLGPAFSKLVEKEFGKETQ